MERAVGAASANELYQLSKGYLLGRRPLQSNGQNGNNNGNQNIGAFNGNRNGQGNTGLGNGNDNGNLNAGDNNGNDDGSNSVGSGNGNRNGNGAGFVAPSVVYVGNGNNDGKLAFAKFVSQIVYT